MKQILQLANTSQEYFYQKIIKIGQCLTKLRLIKDGDVFET